jgi:hypothetical protein
MTLNLLSIAFLIGGAVATVAALIIAKLPSTNRKEMIRFQTVGNMLTVKVDGVRPDRLMQVARIIQADVQTVITADSEFSLLRPDSKQESSEDFFSGRAAAAEAGRAADLIAMRLISRTLAEYLAPLPEQASDSKDNLSTILAQLQDLVVELNLNRRPAIRTITRIEDGISQVIREIGALALNLENPRDQAIKFAVIAANTGGSVASAPEELERRINHSYVKARAAWSSANEARETAGELSRLYSDAYLPNADIRSSLIEISKKCETAMRQYGTLSDELTAAVVINPTEELKTLEIDASGADLSDIYLPDVEILDLVIWTYETSWPDGMLGQIENHSVEIKAGIFQIHSGGQSKLKLVDV